MTDTPEITRLREAAQREFVRENEWVPLADAIQAVRDTEARVRLERTRKGVTTPAPGYEDWYVPRREAMKEAADREAAARREAFREAVTLASSLAEMGHSASYVAAEMRHRFLSSSPTDSPVCSAGGDRTEPNISDSPEATA